MVNDNEIKQLVKQESNAFLERALVQSKGKEASYNLDTEFAKTRHNRSLLVVGVSALTILVLGIAAVGVTRVIEGNIAKSPVNVAAFEDLNLKDILDSSKRNESALASAKLELSQMDADLRTGLADADRDYRSAAESIRTRDLGNAEESKRIAEAAAARDTAKNKLQTDYNASSAKKRTEIAAIQKRIDQYDSRSLAQAKAAESTLSNERRAFDIEKKQLVDLYESRIADLEAGRKRDIAALTSQKDELAASLTARYNPTFADPRSVSLLSTPPRPPAGDQPAFHPYLSVAGVLDAGAEDRLDESLSDYLYLSRKLRSVPYINSVPPALGRLEAELRDSILEYRRALSAAGTGLQQRDQTISSLKARAEAAERGLERYGYAVAALASDSRESVYILDPRDKARILVYVDPSVRVGEGSIGYVARDDKQIATLVFHLDGSALSASAQSVAAGQALRPFDAVSVDASNVAPTPTSTSAPVSGSK